MSESKKNKVILFSTRFLENEDCLFSKGNYDCKYIESEEFQKYFLSKEAIGENTGVIDYFNRIKFYDFFVKFKDEENNPLINIDDSYNEIKETIMNIAPQNEIKSLIDITKKFKDNSEKEILTVSEESCKKDASDKKILCAKLASDEDIKKCYDRIKEFEGKSINNDVTLNTDFGKAIEKRTIDRRFKIYKLKTENSKQLSNISVYAIWCLSKGSSTKAESWYKALYEELKSQLGQEFNGVGEIQYFLHDGDIDAKKPFDVISYKETNTSFSFLDENKKLSIAIFDHSNSQVAKALRTSDIDEAVKMVEDAMKKGGALHFLYELSDCISRWTQDGKKEYIEKTTDIILKKFPNIDLKYTHKENNVMDADVSLIFKNVKAQIDNLMATT